MVGNSLKASAARQLKRLEGPIVLPDKTYNGKRKSSNEEMTSKKWLISSEDEERKFARQFREGGGPPKSFSSTDLASMALPPTRKRHGSVDLPDSNASNGVPIETSTLRNRSNSGSLGEVGIGSNIQERAPQWVPDEEALSCKLCGSSFTSFKRKHHCRACGQVFCGACCSQKRTIERYGFTKPVRVCTKCAISLDRFETQTRLITGKTSDYYNFHGAKTWTMQ